MLKENAIISKFDYGHEINSIIYCASASLRSKSYETILRREFLPFPVVIEAPSMYYTQSMHVR